MKKTCILAAFLILLSLSGCSKFFIPKEITIDNVVYRCGFYGDLWPINIEYSGEAIEIDGNEYHYVKNDHYDWVHSSLGATTNGIIYCAESQWEQAKTYYSNPSNFKYYCTLYNVNISIPDFDFEMFDALAKFAAANSYDPFNQAKNNKVKTLDLPIPDNGKSPELVFYKESADGCFTSYQGDIYHILDGKLYLVFYYDYGHGKYEKMVCVAVPDEISQYIVGLSEQYDF